MRDGWSGAGGAPGRVGTTLRGVAHAMRSYRRRVRGVREEVRDAARLGACSIPS